MSEVRQPFALRKCSLLTTEPVDFHRGRSYAPIADTLPVAGGTSGLPKEPTAFLSYPNQLGGQLQWCSGGARLGYLFDCLECGRLSLLLQ